MSTLSLSNKKLFLAAISLVAVAALALASCAPYQARKAPLKHSSEGMASWYGPGFHGRKTANGERYNQNSMTAAHKTLPFNSTIHVTNLDNGKSVVVRINDRGPFVRGRVIDLSKAAANEIGMLGTGTARVRLASLSQVKSLDEDTDVDAVAFLPETVSKKNQKLASAKKLPANRPVTRNGVEWVISQQPPDETRQEMPQEFFKESSQEEPAVTVEAAPVSTDEERF